MADISNEKILNAEKALVDAEKVFKEAEKALEDVRNAESIKKAEAAKKVAEDKKLEATKNVENAKKSFEMSKKILEDLKSAYRLFGQGDLIKFWLFEDHRLSTKWLNYFPVYEKWFSPYRGKDIVFVEVGVWKGGSIQMWKDYFGKDAKIIGVDIDPKCKQFEDEQISIEIGSQDDPNFWATFKEKYPRVDILLDDGGHRMNQQIVTFREMFPHIKDGGLYMCKDCHTSYYEKYGGGVNNPESFIEFTKRLVDEINAYWTGGVIPETYNTRNINGIHFYTSMVVVEKKEKIFRPLSFNIGETQ